LIVISMRAPFGASCCRVPQRMLPSQLANVGGQMLVTKRLRLREWREADKPLLAEIHSDPEVMRFLGGVKTFDETSEVIAPSGSDGIRTYRFAGWRDPLSAT
jgi:RimJ/RimL family protein N-acetyltransferase